MIESDLVEDTTFDEILDILSVHYRRWLLYLLLERTTTTIDKVVSELLTLDSAVKVNDENVTERQVAVRLIQIDLPKLADADLIDYDRRHGDIVLTNDFQELREFVETMQQWEEAVIQTEFP